MASVAMRVPLAEGVHVIVTVFAGPPSAMLNAAFGETLKSAAFAPLRTRLLMRSSEESVSLMVRSLLAEVWTRVVPLSIVLVGAGVEP
jgi:hypothetical protein